MSLIKKIRSHGFRGTVKALSFRISRVINNVFYYLARVIPVSDRLIVMESEGDLSDNAYALYDYMLQNGYLEKYRIVWLVDNVKKAKKNSFPNTDYVKKYPYVVSYKRSRYLATCKWYIYDHCNVLSKIRKREEQTVVYLSHGWGYKAPKGEEDKVKTHYDYLVATGSLAAEGLSLYWKEPMQKAVITGYPRIDFFFNSDMEKEATIKKRFGLEKYKKIIIWMPTFRKSTSHLLSEDYIDNQTGLPLFYDVNELIVFSDYLKSVDVAVVLKIHHLQANLDVFSNNFDNIVILRDEDINKEKIQLYEFIPIADAMISDYSSVAIDYLALNKPLVYILDDYYDYEKSRGLFPKNAIDYMPGYHVYTIDELKYAIKEICDGQDCFSDERRKLTSQYHSYLDGNSARRLLNFLKI